MIRLLAVGLWAGLVAAGSSHAMGLWLARGAAQTADAVAHVEIEHRKTRTINAPVVNGAQVLGYVVAQFGFSVDKKLAATSVIPPDAVLVDEAFRMIYSGEAPDARRAGKTDLSRLTQDLATRVNARLKAEIVSDVLVQDYTFVGRDDVRR